MLIFMPFEIFSICVWLWYFFKNVELYLIPIYINSLGCDSVHMRFPTEFAGDIHLKVPGAADSL